MMGRSALSLLSTDSTTLTTERSESVLSVASVPIMTPTEELRQYDEVRSNSDAEVEADSSRLRTRYKHEWKGAEDRESDMKSCAKPYVENTDRRHSGDDMDSDYLDLQDLSVNNDDDYLYDVDLKESMESMDSFEIPSVFLTHGMHVLKVSRKSKKRMQFKVDPSNFKFIYKQTTKSKVYEFLADDIRSILAREDANICREEFGISKEFERRWLSVVYFNHEKNKLKSLNLITDTKRDLKKLLFVIEKFKKLKDMISDTFFLNLGDLDDVKRHIVSGKAESAVKQPKELLTISDVLKFSKRLNVNMNNDFIQQLYNNVRKDGNEGIDFSEFKKFVKLLKKREEIAPIWNILTKGKEVMFLEDFRTFIKETQEENYDSDSIKRLFKKFSTTDSDSQLVWLEDNWSSFLLSKYSNPLTEELLDEQYFKHPLNEYHILSSHNTYLMGRQVAGDSSVEGYIKALRKGCRCLEIDIWNNENDADAEPIVNHGRTFSNGISLSSVLKTIKRYAFSVSAYPVILSLEMHCTENAQINVVNLLRQILGDAMVEYPINSENTLPSPDELKHRILIKVKKTSGFSNVSVDETGKFVSTSTTYTSFSESNDSSPAKMSLKLRRKSTRNVVNVLSDFGVYVQGIKFRNFSLPESKTFNHCFSLGEKSINSMIKDEGKRAALDKHNRKFLMRVYPSKIRLMSSNFIPINYWAHGVQMVATNWQTYDLGQQLNESFFSSTKGKGYILKPSYLRRPLLKSSMRNTLSKFSQKIKFSIEVISAQQLPRPAHSAAINPFVIAEIVGAKSVSWDPDSRIGATKIVAGNGHSPYWGLIYSGFAESEHQLVFLRLTIHSSASASTLEDTKEICILVTNIWNMKQGFRYYPLKDPCGEKLLYSTIFLRVNWCIVK